MKCRIRSILPFLLALNLTLSGCGFFGEKEDSDGLGGGENPLGCLDGFGPLLEDFVVGKADPEQWVTTWDCAINAVEDYVGLVKASSSDGYTSDDILGLISAFLIKSTPVSRGLVDSSLALKASLLGGSVRAVSKAELVRFLTLLRVGKDVTANWGVHLKNRAENPTPENLWAFAEAIREGGKQISDAMVTGDYQPLSEEMARLLLDELGSTFEIKELEADWASFVFKAKAFLEIGSGDSISSQDWRELFRVGGLIGGAVAAFMSLDDRYMDGVNQPFEMILSLGQIVRDELIRSTRRTERGGLSQEKADVVIDNLPEMLRYISPPILKKLSRALFQKLLWSTPEQGFSEYSVRMTYYLLERWVRGESLMELIFSKYGLNRSAVGSREFSNKARDYALRYASEGEVDDIERLAALAEHYKPLYRPGEGTRITIQRELPNSLHNLKMFYRWYLVASHATRSYSGDHNRFELTLEQTVRLMQDVTPVLKDMGLVDLSESLITLIFYGGDLATFDSNGDGLFDYNEVAYVLAFAISMADLASEYVSVLREHCQFYPGAPLSPDEEYFEYNCARYVFWDRADQFLKNFPELLDAYSRLSDKKREKMEAGLFAIAAANDKDDGLPKYVVAEGAAMTAGVLLFSEAIFQRLDKDGSARLETQELLDAAPLFHGTVERVVPPEFSNRFPITEDWVIEAALTFALEKPGEVKPLLKAKASAILKVIGWVAKRPFWKVKAGRESIFELLGAFEGMF